MKSYLLALTALLLLPLLPVAAQERCVQNRPHIPNSSQFASELAFLREELIFATDPNHISFLNQEIRSLERRLNMDAVVGLGNGWIADMPNSCILYISASNEPVMGTRIYRLEAGKSDDSTAVPGGQPAVVTDGPARIRSGPGLQHSRLAWCANGAALTVFPPAVDNWLPASCYGSNGWVYAPLVQYDDAPIQPGPAPVSVSEVSAPVSGQRTTVIDGPARIRSGPGLQHPGLAWCANGAALTVFPPAVDNWLPASCYGSNGWVYAPLVQYDDAPIQPGPAPVSVSEVTAPVSGQRATVIDGPARIRSGPGLQHSGLAWCATGATLTVFPPALDNWLPVSCYGANGWIHASLVQVDDAPTQPGPAPVSTSEVSAPVSGEQAVVISGPAHIRSGPGQEHPHLRWCGIGWNLTVWPPAQNGWLPASCYGANGWIHESLVAISE
ncbi:MAG: hypothetical protein OXF32_07485 [Anaerolineaceae bacterium]|nr:hypothetical protein [Anaerolineaceae bacterium]